MNSSRINTEKHEDANMKHNLQNPLSATRSSSYAVTAEGPTELTQMREHLAQCMKVDTGMFGDGVVCGGCDVVAVYCA